MTDIHRIEPSEAVLRLQAGALLVCAYDNEAMFRKNHLNGAISLQEFHARRSSWKMDQELIFYCA